MKEVKEMNRLKSWALWVSVGALVVWIVKTVANVDISETVNSGLDVLLPVVVGFGIVNNPTNRDSL